MMCVYFVFVISHCFQGGRGSKDDFSVDWMEFMKRQPGRLFK